VPSVFAFSHNVKKAQAADDRRNRLARRENVQSLVNIELSENEFIDTTPEFYHDTLEPFNEPVTCMDTPEPEEDLHKSCQTEHYGREQEVQTDPVPDLTSKGPLISIHRLKEDPETIYFYTGFQSFDHFMYLYQSLGPAVDQLNFQSRCMSTKDELFLCLIKLRLDKEEAELAILFRCSVTTVSRVFNTWLNFLYYQFKDLDLFLPKETVDEYMPIDFKKKYPNTRIILDATEVKIEKPSNIKDQSATWSTYKNCNTLKTMIGCSPRGFVTYVSPSYGGSCSDRQIIEASNLLEKSQFCQGDSIMADRGIMVQDLFAAHDVTVNTPTTMRGKNQLPAEVVVKDRRIASKRVHVERVIGLAKTYKILQNEINHSFTPKGGRIIFVCFVLSYFRTSIVGKYC